MKYISIVLLSITLSTVIAKTSSMDELIKEAKEQYHLTENYEEIENIVFKTKKQSQQTVTEDIVDSITESILFSKLRSKTQQTNFTTNSSSQYNTTQTVQGQNNTVYQNYTNTNNSYNYSYTTQNNNGVNNYVISNQSNTTNSSNNTNTTYPINNYTSYNYTYSQQNNSNNNYIYNNQSNTSNNTNNTNSSYPISNYTSYNYSYYGVNQSNSSNSTNYNQTQYNNTQLNYTNSTNQSKLQYEQSRIKLRLRNQSLNQIPQQNYTLNVTYYNQSNNTFEYIVIFNQSNQISNYSNNSYFYYSKDKLITLEKEFDNNGNIIYRNLTFNFALIISMSSYTNFTYQNANAFGTLVQNSNSLNWQFNKQEYKTQPYNSDSNYTNYQGSANYNNGQVNIYNDKNQSQYQSNSELNRNYNGSIQYVDTYSNTNLSSNQSTLNATFNRYDNSSQINKAQNYSSNNYQQNRSTITEDLNLTYSNTQFNNNNYNQQNQQNIQKQNNQYSSQQESSSEIDFNNFVNSTIYTQNYTMNNISQNQQSFKNGQYTTKEIQDNSSQTFSQNFNTADYQSSTAQTVSNASQIYGIGNSSDYNIKSYNEIDTNIFGNQVQQNSISGQQTVQSASNSETTGTPLNSITIIDTNTTITNRNSTQFGNQPRNSNTNTISNSTTTTVNNNNYATQFNSLRGSKKQVTGTWKQLNEEELTQSNLLIIESAKQAINWKFETEQNGYEFDSIVSIKEQIVSGFNYIIKLRFTNQDQNSQIYEVIIYSIPWAETPIQIVSCQKLEELFE